MNRVFGRKKAPALPSASLTDVSGTMGTRINDLDSKISKLEKELKSYRDKLRATKSPAVKTNYQRRAMEVLKRKRMYESQRDQLASQQFNLDQAAFGIQSAKANIETVAAMKQANSELKRTIKEDLKIDEVDEVTDELAEMMEEFHEINGALAANFSTPDEVDELDLEAELEMLEDELEDDALEEDATPSYLQDGALPVEPSSVPTAKVSDADEDEYGLPVARP